MSNQAITSLAIPKVNWDRLRKDYLENFVPFVAQCILSLEPSVVSTPELQTRMLDDFGLQIPQNTLTAILSRAAKSGYVQRKDRAYVPNYEGLNALDFESARQRVLREHNALVGKLIQFASEKHAMQLAEEEAEQVLLSYITQHDIELLQYFVGGTPLPKTQTMTTKQHYLINAFARHLHESDPEGFEYLNTIIKGHMLANALIFPDFSQVQKRFRRVRVYCDTAILLRALGYEGDASQAPCKEVIGLLYELGADVRCFRHTYDEISGILNSVKHMLSSQKSDIVAGPTFRHLSDAGYSPSDVDLELSKLDNKIKALGIEISDKPEYSERFQIDEEALAEALEAEMYGQRPRARLHDVECLTAVYRLRKGRTLYDIEDCVALFVTCNATLARSSQQFLLDEGYVSNGTVPIATTDYVLTTILWLKKPMSAPDLPRKHIIADSYAAMDPGEPLWRKYLAEISSLQKKGDISSDDYYLLRGLPQARTELMDITMGDEEVIVEGTPLEILERIRQGITAELEETIEDERSKRKETERKLTLEQATSREREEKLTGRINGFSRRVARYVSRGVFVLLMFLLLFGTVASYRNILWDFGWGWLNYALSAVLSIGFAFLLAMTILSLALGIRLKDYVSRFEVFLARWVEAKLKAWLLR